jgi:hypothetical protein
MVIRKSQEVNEDGEKCDSDNENEGDGSHKHSLTHELTLTSIVRESI